MPYFPHNNNELEVAVAKEVFKYPSGGIVADRINMGLDTVNGDSVDARNMFFFRINKAPENGNCDVYPHEGYALLTEFEVVCEGWEDPEEIGIKHYVVSGR